jgi:uncharacterized protein (TIGR02594 family)
MKTLYKSALILGILLGATTQVVANESRKVSIKQAEKYCNLSAQTKYTHLAKYCSRLSSKKVIKENTVVVYYTEEETSASYFTQEKLRAESSKLSSDWKNTEKGVQVKKPIPTAKPIRTAREWEGFSAKNNRKELKEYLSDRNNIKIDPVSIAWCAAFMNAILKDSGYEGTNSLMARSFLSYGTKVKSPEEGDIVIFKRGSSSASGHVAFFVGYEYVNNRKFIRALGGNQKKSVNIALYPVEKLLGIRRI